MGRQRRSTPQRIAATGIRAAPLHPPPCRPTRVEGQAGQAAAGAAPRAQGHLQRQLRLGAQGGSRLLGRLAMGGGQQGVSACSVGTKVCWMLTTHGRYRQYASGNPLLRKQQPALL